jgi:hypothetical protein
LSQKTRKHPLRTEPAPPRPQPYTDAEWQRLALRLWDQVTHDITRLAARGCDGMGCIPLGTTTISGSPAPVLVLMVVGRNMIDRHWRWFTEPGQRKAANSTK